MVLNETGGGETVIGTEYYSLTNMRKIHWHEGKDEKVQKLNYFILDPRFCEIFAIVRSWCVNCVIIFMYYFFFGKLMNIICENVPNFFFRFLNL